MHRLALTIFALISVGLWSSSAHSAWVCRATSSTGSWGAGWHTSSLNFAKRRALVECAVRTPRNRTCFIRWCRRR